MANISIIINSYKIYFMFLDLVIKMRNISIEIAPLKYLIL